MNDLPPLTIVMTTYAPAGEIGEKRVDAAFRAMESWEDNLRYEGQLDLHVADDGSDHQTDGGYRLECYGSGLQTMPCTWWAPDADRSRISFSRQERRGVGASLNAGLKVAFQRSPLVAHFVDDWVLERPLDVTPWCKLLVMAERLGVIRLGPPHPDLTGTVQHLPEIGWGLLLDRHHYAFATRPFIMHQRFYEWFGPFKEGISALECEREYNERFCQLRDGPEIMLALPDFWAPIEDTHLSEMVP